MAEKIENKTKILPINKSPTINTYADLAYINAILESDEVLRIKVEKLADYIWIKEGSAKIAATHECIFVRTKLDDKDIEGKILRECLNEDQITINIEYFRRMSNTAYLSLVYQSEDNENVGCGLALTNYGFYFHDELFEYTKRYHWFRIEKSKSLIKYYASIDGKRWEYLFLDTLKEKNILNGRIGIKYSLGNRQLNAWNSMNYLQLCFDVNDHYGKRWIDYFTYPRKNYENLYGTYSHFFDVEYCKYDEICEVYNSLSRFVEYSIDRGYYILIRLDEFYVKNRFDYNKKHYEHDNLIYGYDNNGFYILGYNQKVVASMLSRYEFEKAGCTYKNIIRYRLAINENEFKFDLGEFLILLKEFIEGKDSSKRYCNLITSTKKIYGLDVLANFFLDENAFQLFVTDRRIAYLLNEHCNIMAFRLRYMIEQGYIKRNEDIEKLEIKVKDMSRRAKNTLFLILKYNVTQKGVGVIRDSIKALYNDEKNFYTTLYGVLTESVYDK